MIEALEISRAEIVTFAKCNRKGYYSYFVKGNGVSSRYTNLDILLGIAFHKGFQTILETQGELEPAIEASNAEYDKELERGDVDQGQMDAYQFAWARKEHRHLSEALLRGWHRARWPEFNEQYKVLSIEEWKRTILDPQIKLLSRWDFLAEDRVTGDAFVGNAKTTNDYRDWPLKWTIDPQMWTETIAAESFLSRPVAGCLVVGAMKGAMRDGVRSNPLIHPYIYVGEKGRKYQKGDLSAESQSGELWKKVNAWENPGLAQWVGLQIPLERLQEFFQTTPPIIKDDRVMGSWLKGTLSRHKRALYVLNTAETEEERLEYFDQNGMSHFNCKKCTFYRNCIEGETIEDSLASGRLQPRTLDHRPAPEEE